MRILTVTNLYPTDRDQTHGTFVGDQVAALRRHPKVVLCDVMFVDGRASRWNYLRALPDLRARLAAGTYDVVLAHYGLTGAVAVTQRQIPVVINYHGGDLLQLRWQRAVSRLAYRFAADAISVSVQGLSRLPGPAHHVTCGIDLGLFTPRERVSARRSFDVADGELAVLFPSSPARGEKMYSRFAAVLEELRARGHSVHELQLRDLPRARVPELMAAADVMLLTSRREATPVAAMEALACGLPIVATPVGDVPSMLAGAGSARCLPFSAAAFADAAQELLAGAPPRRDADPVSRQFAQEELTDRLVEILEVAARRNRGAG